MKKKTASAFLLESLEPRLLFSADSLIPLSVGGVLPNDTQPSLQVPLPPAISIEQIQLQSQQVREVIFVDAGVDDYQLLIDDLKSSGDDQQQYAFHILDSHRDGIEQISATLKQYQGVSAVHLISHGSDGELQLGSTLLTADNLNQYRAQIQGWQSSLNEQADFLFYSCDLAQSDRGKEFLETLGGLAAVDVAASDDLTGHATLGGDWDLEYQVGQIETKIVVSQQTQINWSVVLADISGKVFSADGATPLGSGHNISLVVNGAVVGSDITDVNSDYSINTTLNPGDNFLVYINDGNAGTIGITAAKSDGGDIDFLNLDITQSSFTVRGDASGNVTTSDLQLALGSYSDTELKFSFNGNELTNTLETFFIPGGVTFTAEGDVVLNGLKLEGTLQGGDNSFEVQGNWDASVGTFIGSPLSTLTFTSGPDVTFDPGTSTYGNITIDKPTNAKLVTLNNDLVVAGDLSVTTGNLDVSSLNHAITVGGDLTIAGAFTAGSGTVTLNGSNQTISGTISFHNLIKNVDSSDTLTFQAGSSLTVTGTVNLSGKNVGNSLTLVSSLPGSIWSMILNSGATAAIDYVDVSDSYGGVVGVDPIILATNSINSGNNTAWNFFGTNDAPVITDGPDMADLDETNAALTAAGSLTVTDVDTSDLVTALIDSLVISGTSDRADGAAPSDADLLAMFSISTSAILDGTQTTAPLGWSFDSGTEAFDYLATGETLILTYTVQATDDNSTPLNDTETVTITITGSNDAPVITAGPDTADLAETDAALTSSGSLTVTDVDTTNLVTATSTLVVTGTSNRSDVAAPSDASLLAMFTINPTTILDGTQNSAVLDWSFDSGTEAFDYLAAGETLILTYTLQATDDDGTPLNHTETVTITITGSNDETNLVGADLPQVLPIMAVNAGDPLDGTAVGGLISDYVGLMGDGGIENVIDPDAPLAGVAITQSNETVGRLFYSTDNGEHWNSVPPATIGPNNALMLAADADTRIYYRPNDGYTGYISKAFTFRAWDTTGTGNGSYLNLTPPDSISSGQKGVGQQVTLDGTNAPPTAINHDTKELYTIDTALNLPDLVVSDVDSDKVAVTLTMPDTIVGGFFSLPVYNPGPNEIRADFDPVTLKWNVVGDLAAVNDVMSQLVFSPSGGYSAAFSVDVSITDGMATLVSTKVFSTTAVNTPPTATPNTVSTHDDDGYTFSVDDFTFTDPEGDSLLTVTISNLNLGGGTLTHSGGFTVVNGSELSAAQLNTLIYIPLDDTVGLPLATFDFTVNDVNPGVGAVQMSINVTDDNDAPIITDGPDTADLDEANAALSVSGSLTVTDADTSDVVTASIDSLVITGTSDRTDVAAPSDADLLAMFSISTSTILDGTQTTAPLGWSFDSGTEAFDYLATGETLILTYTVQATDDNSTPLNDTETVTITITGSNDAPVITAGPDTADLDETDAALSASGSLIVTDVDTTDLVTATRTLAVSGTSNRSDVAAPSDAALLTMFTINPTAILDGTQNSAVLDWSFDSGTEAFDYLAAGETLILTYSVQATDDAATSLSDTETVTITITGSNDAPTISGLNGDSLVYVKGSAPQVIDQGSLAIVADVDSANFEFGELRVSIALGNVPAEDVLSIRNQGSLANEIGYSGGIVFYEGVEIGSAVGGANGNPLVIAFNEDATLAAVTALVQNITYEDTNAINPVAGSLVVRFVVNDGDGDSVNYDTSVTISKFNTSPVFSDLDANPGYTENSAAVVLDNNATVSDPELTVANNYAGSILTLVRNGGTSSEDQFGFVNGNGLTLVGNEVIKNSKVIATWDTTSIPGQLEVAFTDANGEDPLQVDVDFVLQQITYTNLSGALSAGSSANVQIDYTFNDGNSGAAQGPGGSQSAAGSITVEISGANDAPVANDDGSPITPVSTPEETAVVIDVTANDTDIDGSIDPTTVTIGTSPANGSLSVDAVTGAVTYTPEADFIGTDSFTYRIKDDSGALSNIATVYVNVTPVNDAPVANDDGSLIAPVSTPEETAVVIDVTANDTDIDGSIDPTTVTIVTSPASGSLSVDTATGAVTYTPTANFVGIDSFTYRVEDDSGRQSNDATVYLDVTPGNDAPTANDDFFVIAEDTPLDFSFAGLLGNDFDPEGDTLTLTFADPDHGSLNDNGDGTLTYQSNPNYFGTDSFDYTITDTAGNTATGKAFVVVSPVGDTPRVANVTTTAGVTSNLITISRNASDGAEVTHFRISGITNGALYLADGTTLVTNGDFITFAQGQAGLRFAPAITASGTGSFQVESSQDGATVASQSGAVVSTITITAVPAEPDMPAENADGAHPVDAAGEVTDNTIAESVEDPGPVIDAVVTQEPQVEQVQQKPPRVSPFVERLSGRRGDVFLTRSEDTASVGDNATVDKIKILLESVNYETLVTVFKEFDIPALSEETYQLVHSALDSLHEEMAADSNVERTIIVSSIATSVGLSAGYVIWLLQGGTLLTSVLASMPAWQLADPLTILAGRKLDDEDDDSLENIIEEGSSQDDENDDDPEATAGGSA